MFIHLISTSFWIVDTHLLTEFWTRSAAFLAKMPFFGLPVIFRKENPAKLANLFVCSQGLAKHAWPLGGVFFGSHVEMAKPDLVLQSENMMKRAKTKEKTRSGGTIS